MVSKITVFETRFEGVQFGPASVGSGADEAATGGDEATAERGGSTSRVVTVLQGATVFVVLFVALWVLLSRLLSEDEPAASA